MSERTRFLAEVRETGSRSDGSLYRIYAGLRPGIQFPGIPALDGSTVYWDANVEEVEGFDRSTRQCIMKLSMNPSAPRKSIVPGALFTLREGPKEIAQGKVIAVQSLS